ncbi:MAG: hypothetical protein ACOVQE_07680 [Chitinophagaceae bacterium]
MKKYYIFIILVFFNLGTLWAQPFGDGPGGGALGKDVQALKIAFLTRQINLTTEEAQKFWPVYFAFLDEMKQARKENRDNIIAFEEKALAIKKRYQQEFKKVLNSDQRVNRVFSADMEFNEHVKRVLMRRQQMRNGGGLKKERGNDFPPPPED